MEEALSSSATLPSPVMVGWSGIEDRKTSKGFLNVSMWSELMLLRLPRDLYLAFLTTDGAACTTGLGIPYLPLLPMV